MFGVPGLAFWGSGLGGLALLLEEFRLLSFKYGSVWDSTLNYQTLLFL